MQAQQPEQDDKSLDQNLCQLLEEEWTYPPDTLVNSSAGVGCQQLVFSKSFILLLTLMFNSSISEGVCPLKYFLFETCKGENVFFTAGCRASCQAKFSLQ